MHLFVPNIYQKDIYSINYDNLKNKGIKCLIFDLDNTLGLIENIDCPNKTKELIKRLKKEFTVYICSNNTQKRLQPYLECLGIDGVSWSMKPLGFGLKRINKKSQLDKAQMCIIGDQMITDILAGKRYGIVTVLTDSLGKKDLKITSFNRFIEKIIVKYYEKKGLFERGRYYE